MLGLCRHWREALPNPMLTLEFKDWVEDFPRTLRRVLDFLDLPYDAACARAAGGPWPQPGAPARQRARHRTLDPCAPHLQPLLAELATAGALPMD
jgi:hypothetical protein